MSFTENKQKKVEGGETPATSPQSFQTKNASEYTQDIKFYPEGYRMHEDKEADNEVFKTKQANLRRFYGNSQNLEAETKAENFLPKAATNFRLLLQGWQATENHKTWSKNSREFDAVRNSLLKVIPSLAIFDKYLETQHTGTESEKMARCIGELYADLLPDLMRDSAAYIKKNDKLIVWSAVGRERFRLANNILVQAACARKYLGVYCLNESAQGEDRRNRGIIQGRITLTGRRCSKMDTTIANMKSNDYGEEFVSCMNDMNNCLKQMNTIPGKGNYGQIKQKLDALISRYNERKYNQEGVSVDIFSLAKELEELCYAYTRKYGKPTTKEIDNHLTLVSNIAMRAIMIQQQCK